MGRYLVYLFLAVFVLACGGDEVPADVLPPKQMEAIIWDLLRADELADHYYAKDSSLTRMQFFGEQYDRVFAIHGLTRQQLQQSLRYYESRPEKLKPIFDTVQARAERITSGATIK